MIQCNLLCFPFNVWCHVTSNKSSTMPWHWLPAWGWVACHCCSSRKAYGFLRPKHFIIAQSTKLSWNQGTLQNSHWAMKRTMKRSHQNCSSFQKIKIIIIFQSLVKVWPALFGLSECYQNGLENYPPPQKKTAAQTWKQLELDDCTGSVESAKTRKKSFISRVNLRLFRPEIFHV